MSKKSKKLWDKEDIYDVEIAPLMEQIIKTCKDNDIPLVAVFQYCNKDKDGPGFCTTRLVNDNADDYMKKLSATIDKYRPQADVMLAITEVLNENGCKDITIKRV